MSLRAVNSMLDYSGGGAAGKTASSASDVDASVSEASKDYNSSSQIRDLLSGQTISGQVVEVKDGQVKLLITGDSYLTAKLENDYGLALGQNVSFQVKGNSGSQVSLSPLYSNLTNANTMHQALSQALIPINDKSMQMISSMMEGGMSIDKNSVQDMYGKVMENESASPTSIVEMSRLNITITSENIGQFESYKNYEHQLINGIETVTQEMSDTLMELVNIGNVEEAVSLFNDLLNIFGSDSILGDELTGTIGSAAEGEINQFTETLPGEAGLLNETANNGSTILTAGNPQTMTVEEKIAALTKQIADVTNLQKGEAGIEDKTQNTQIAQTALTDIMKNLGVTKEQITQMQNQTMSSETVLQTVKQLLGQENINAKDIKALFSNKEFHNLLSNLITKNWVIEPEELKKEGKVDDLYERIREQTNKIATSLENIMKEDSSAMKSVNNIRENVSFLNQLNQNFTFVQLPLKLSGQKANGDLYVYTNKKNLAKKDGNVSAFLHLDMEYLGSVDVYVAMQNRRVSTKFYLEDDNTMDFIMDNINILNDRLESRGYSMNTEVTVKGQDTNVMEEILNQDKNVKLISQTAFDMRA